MENYIENLEGILRAIDGNPLGIIAIAMLSIMIVVISLMMRAPVWAKLTSIALTFIAGIVAVSYTHLRAHETR